MQPSLVCAIYLASIFAFATGFEKTSQGENSCFAFFHTDARSPKNLKDTCFEITSDSVNDFYKGVSMYVMDLNTSKPFSCSFEDIKLETIQKYIIVNGTRQRRLCMKKMIFSINTTNCKDKIRSLWVDCIKPILSTKSLFFQSCAPVDCFQGDWKTEERFSDEEALIPSQFPRPTGLSFNIPKSHCDMRQCKLENCSNDQLKNFIEDKSVHKLRQPEDKECMLFAIGSGGGGLLVGILLTSVICFLLNKYKNNYRSVGDVSFFKRNMHQLSETERKLSIYSKERETVYHDISDVPSPSKIKAIQRVGSNILKDDSPKQRYSESPKSSTSAYENGSISSQLSSKRAPTKVKEDSQKSEEPQIYHILAIDNKVNSKNVIISTDEQIGVTVTDNNHETETKSTMEGQQYSVYESPVRQQHVLIPLKVEPDSTDLSDDTVELLLETEDVTKSLHSIYHTLHDEECGFMTEMSIEIESKADQDKKKS